MSPEERQSFLEEIKFPLYHDRDIGFEREQDQSCIKEVQLDDDVDTDEDVYDSALKQCSRDFNEARHKMNNYPAIKSYLNNSGIKKRVQRPELFDRYGKFCAFE